MFYKWNGIDLLIDDDDQFRSMNWSIRDYLQANILFSSIVNNNWPSKRTRNHYRNIYVPAVSVISYGQVNMQISSGKCIYEICSY